VLGLLHRYEEMPVMDVRQSRSPATRTVDGAAVARRRPRVVILGAGFGGLNAALALKKAPVDVTVIDRHNYHLFQPLLYQVATAGLSPAQIATPIRAVLARQKNAAVLMDRVTDIDLDSHEVVTVHRRIPYDYLIVATGARHAYFGHDDWEAYAPGLKKIDDATGIRRRVLLAFEHAETCPEPSMQTAVMTFVVVGGGPTGVEMAGAIVELTRKALARDFRNIDPRMTRVLLVEAGPRILPTFPESLSASAKRQLEALGAEVLTGVAVTDCTSAGVRLSNGEEIRASTVVWAAGVIASPAARWLKASEDRAGRVVVGEDLSLHGHPEIFVIGDTASVAGEDDKPVPGVAPAAKQMGLYVANLIVRRVMGREAPRPFRYRDFGNLATIGRKAAVADFGRLRLTGFPAWIVWSLAHVYFLIGFRNRLVVTLDWLWSYLSFHRGARLITGNEG
jgi:NADH:quinone reductase (non-electrogenic)